MSEQVLTSIRLVIGAPSEQRMELVPRKSAISTEGRFVFTDDTHKSDDVIQNDALPNIDSSPIHLPELNKIIETVVTTDRCEANKVINAYRQRAKLFFGMKNYAGCIADATCIIERRAFDSNAYVIRSQGFLFAKRFYEAYEDVLRACILEKFAEAALNDLLMKMIKQIGEFVHSFVRLLKAKLIFSFSSANGFRLQRFHLQKIIQKNRLWRSKNPTNSPPANGPKWFGYGRQPTTIFWSTIRSRSTNHI